MKKIDALLRTPPWRLFQIIWWTVVVARDWRVPGVPWLPWWPLALLFIAANALCLLDAIYKRVSVEDIPEPKAGE